MKKPKKPQNKCEVASTLLGSERLFGQVHLLWQIFGLEEEESDDDDESSGGVRGSDTDDEDRSEDNEVKDGRA